MITEKEKQVLENLLKKFNKICVNYYPAEDPEGGPALYKRSDFCQWAEDAFNRGEKYFYAEPVVLNDHCGEYKLCEPKYCYSFNDTFSAENYNCLLKLYLKLKDI